MRRLVALRSVRTLAFPDRSREGLIAALRGKTAACPALPSRCFSGLYLRQQHGQTTISEIIGEFGRDARAAHDRAVRTPGRVSNEAVHGAWRLCGAGGGGAAPQPVRHRARRCRDGAPRHRGRRASARDTPGARATSPRSASRPTSSDRSGLGWCWRPPRSSASAARSRTPRWRCTPAISTASCWRRRMAPIVCFTLAG